MATYPDVRRALARAAAVIRVNELLNWQVAAEPGARRGRRVRHQGVLLRAAPGPRAGPGRGGRAARGPADPDTAELMTWLDVQLKRNIVLTFGGGVNEVQRELIAIAGLGLPRAPR